MTINGVKHKKIIDDKVLFSVCCGCSRMYGVKPAKGTKGGLSHGFCRLWLLPVMAFAGYV